MELLRWTYDSETWDEIRRLRTAYLRRRGKATDDTPVGDFPDAPPTEVLFTATGVIIGKKIKRVSKM